MRKTISTLAVLVLITMIAIPGVVGATGAGTWTVDIGNPAAVSPGENQPGIAIAGWGPIEPATHGGSWGGFGTTGENCRVMWEPPTPSDSLRCATVTYTYDECVVPTGLEWRVLDGQADDSYEVYVDGVLVYTYTDAPPANDPEAWHVISQDLTGFTFPNDVVHVVEFCATGPAWGSFATYGQAAVDWVELTTEECSGNTEVEIEITVLSTECLCIDVNPTYLNFGSFRPGETATLPDALTITNCGNVDAEVTASASSAFFQDNLYLEGSSWDLVGDWEEEIAVSDNLTIDAQVQVPDPYPIGTETGTITFWAAAAD